MNTNFIILKAMYQNLWVFENFRRSLSKVGMCWQELTTLKLGRRIFILFAKGEFRWSTVADQKAGTPGRLVTSGYLPVAARKLTDCRLAPSFFWQLLNFKFYFFWYFEDGHGIMGEWMYNTSIFWTLPLHLEG